MAGSGRDIKAGSAFIELALKGRAQVEKALQNISSKFKAWGATLQTIGASIAGFGALILGSLGALTVNFASAGAALDDMSSRTGIAANTLSELGFAATQSGTDLDAVATGVKFMQKALVEAGKGGKNATALFEALGLSVADLMTMSPDAQFKAIAEAISKVEDPAIKAALAMGIFGKSGTDLLPLLSEGKEGIEALQQTAKDIGISISPEDAKAAAELDDAIDKLKTTVKGLALQIGAALAPALSTLVDAAQNVLQPIVAFVRENQNLVAVVAIVGAGLVAAGTLVAGLGVAFAVAGAAISGFVAVMSALSAVFAVVASPVFLVVAGVLALAVAIAAAVAWALKAAGAFDGMGKMFGATWTALVAAVKSGDLSLAFQIVVKQVEVIWIQLINALKGLWDDFIHYIASKLLQIPGASKIFGPDAQKALDEDFDRKAKDREKRLEDLKRELADLQKQATESTAQLPAGKGNKMNTIFEAKSSINAGLQSAISDLQRGTFSGDFAALRMGQAANTGGPEDRTAKATEESAKTLKELLEETKRNVLEFA